MKNLLLFLSSLLFFSIASDAIAQFNVGIIGGWNVSNLDIKDREVSNVWNYGVGAVANYYFNENIALQLEPMYLEKGGVMEASSENPRIDLSLSYIELPVLFKYDFGNTENFYLLGGLSFGYLISNEISTEINTFPFKGDMKQATNDFDLGGTLGAGIKFPAGPIVIFLEAKYTLGFLNLQKGGTVILTNEAIDTELSLDMNSEKDKYTSSGIQIMAGVMISL